jgi:hypothetical protein
MYHLFVLKQRSLLSSFRVYIQYCNTKADVSSLESKLNWYNETVADAETIKEKGSFRKIMQRKILRRIVRVSLI